MNYMKVMLMDTPKPEWLEIIAHTITGVIGGCAAALPVAIKHRQFAGYIIGGYAVVGAIAAFVSGVLGYIIIDEGPAQSVRVFALAAGNGLAIPVALMLFRTITHTHLKTKYGDVDFDFDRGGES